MTSQPTILLFYLNPLDWASIAAPPYGLEILAASVQDLAVKVAIHNPFLYQAPGLESRQLIASLAPLMIGLSLRNLDNLAHVWDTEGEFYNGIQSHSFLPEVAQTIDAIRGSTTAPIVIGGRSFSIAPVKLLRQFGLDVGVVGPGEVAFRQLVQAALSGQNIREFALRQAAGLPGIVVLGDSGVVVETDNAPAKTVWPDLPLPIERMAAYNPSWTGFVPVRASEGCLGRCTFCVEARPQQGMACRPPEQVVAEMAGLDTSQTSAVWLTCGEFNLPDEKHTINLCRHISAVRRPELILYSYFQPHPFSPDLYHALREAGFTERSMWFDIVHPCDRILERNRVGFRRRDLDNFVNDLLRVGATGLGIGLMLGLPGETEETLHEAVEWLRQVDALFGAGLHCSYNCGARVYPGTGLEQIARAETNQSLLYGADDPDYLQPVVYSAPWSPQRLEATFRAACAGLQATVTNYTKGNPMFHEQPEVIISWQRAHAHRCMSHFDEAVTHFRQALSLAERPVVQAWIAEALAPCLVQLGRLKEARKLQKFILSD